MEYTIIGSEVNLAARLEQAAQPGGILVSSSTYALVRDEVRALQHAPVIAKGFVDPIPAYSACCDDVVEHGDLLAGVAAQLH